ncbi:MAG: restriction endonuclease subunit S [Myxococcota bacterium]
MSGEEPQDLGLAILPPGWASARVGEISRRVVVGFVGPAKQHYRAEGVPFLMGKNIRNGALDLSDISRVTLEFHRSLPKSELHAGDVAVVRIGRSGDAAVVPGGLGPANCAGLVVVKQPTGTSPEFLARYFNSPQGKRASEDEARGVTRKTLNTRKVEQALVPVPPLNEQRRIVAKIEALQERSKAAKDALDAIPPLLEKFRQSVLAAAFRGDLTKSWRERQPEIEPAAVLLDRIRAERRRRFSEANPKKKYVEPAPVDPSGLPELPAGWCWVRLQDIASLLNGDRGKNYPNQREYVEVGLPFINAGHIRPDGTLSGEEMNFITREKFNELAAGKIEPGDLVYCLRGTLGKTATVDPLIEGAIASSLAIIRPGEAEYRKFLYYFLVSPLGRAEIKKYDNGSAQPNLSAASVGQYLLPMPPRHELSAFCSAIEEALAAVAASVSPLKRSLALAQTLDQSILAKAFRGELVPQDPNDEPASVLLERIRAEREAAGPAKTKRRRST